MKKFIALFKKTKGGEVLRQYLRSGVLIFSLVQTALLGFSKKALELVRLGVTHKLVARLRRKNKRVIADFKKRYVPQERVRSNKVWVCWLQGMEQAPEIVQCCYNSLQKNLPDREIVLLTEENYRDYVTFPDYIQEKIEKGIITRTHMSDLLRLELLIRYGGTWIDATVYCSGWKIPGYMLDSDLFMFQNLKPGLDGHATRISSWFMTACTNHPILLLARQLVYHYWRTKNSMVDYFLVHDMLELAIEAYPDAWKQVVPFSNATPHILLLRMFEDYDRDMWAAICDQTPFHKLSYKFSPEEGSRQGTYYSHLLNR